MLSPRLISRRAAGVFAALALALVAAPPFSALAQLMGPDTVIATVNGDPITGADLALAGAEFTEQLSQVAPDRRDAAVLDLVINMRLASAAAQASGMDKEPLVVTRLDLARDRTLYSEFLRSKFIAAVTEASVRARFDEQIAKFVPQEEIKARHILVNNDQEALAREIIAELDAGGDFAKIAAEKSTDTGSGQSGGDLGWFKRGMMVKPFEEAAFALEPGQYTKTPVKSDFGWHVIQLREVKSGSQQTFEQAREALAREQAEADRERAFNDVSSRLVDQVYKNPSSLAPAAREVNLPVQKLGPFARTGAPGIAATPAVLRAAFSDSLIEDGTVSDPIEIAPGHSVMIRVVAHAAERALPLAQVREKVTAAIHADRTRKAATKEAETLLARLRSGETLEALAASKQLPPPQALGNVPRGAPVPEPSQPDAFFSVPAPAAGKTSPGMAVLSRGDIVLFTVNKVTPGDVNTMPPGQRQMLMQQVAQIGGSDDADAFVKAMRKRVRINVVERNL